jgi:hypothetical protein
MVGNILMISESDLEMGSLENTESRVLHYRLQDITSGYLVEYEDYRFMNLFIGGHEFPVEYDKEDWARIKKWLASTDGE